MASADEYRQQLEALGLLNGTRSFKASSALEAKQLIVELRQLQSELKQIKRNIDYEIKVIRAGYQQKISEAGTGTASVFRIFGQRKLAGSMRADAKRSVTNERDKVLRDYSAVKLNIENILAQVDVGKLKIQQYIEDEKQKEAVVSG